MGYTPHKVIVTLNNGNRILCMNGVRESVAFDKARYLRALGYDVEVIAEVPPEEETESVQAVLEGIHGE